MYFELTKLKLYYRPPNELFLYFINIVIKI